LVTKEKGYSKIEVDHDGIDEIEKLAEKSFLIGDYAKAEKLLKEAIKIRGKSLGKDHPDYAASLNNLAEVYNSEGDYKKAERLYKEALEITRKSLGNDHPDYATSLNNLAGVYSSVGDYEKAERLYKEALEIIRKSLGKDHPNYATFLNNLAEVYRSVCDYKKAEALLIKVIEMKGKSLGKDHPDFAASLNNLALVYDSIGDYEQAEALYKKAIEICRKSLGKNHPDYAVSLNNLAEIYSSVGDYRKAAKLQKEALEIIRKSLGKDHPNYATSLNNLALVFDSIGDYEQAEALYEESLEITGRSLGKDHPDYAASLSNLASIYYSNGDYEKAERLYKEALEIIGKASGKDDPNYAAAMNNLAVVYDSIGDYEKAERLQKEDLEITRKSLGKDHPDYATSLNNLASVYDSIGDYEKAERLLSEALEIRGSSLGKDHPDYATSLSNLARVYYSIGNFAKAAKLQKEALEITRKSLGKDHPDYATSLNNLASIFCSIGNFAKAAKLQKEALEIRGRSLGKDHPDYATSLNNLASLYILFGDYKIAERLYNKALEIVLESLGGDHPDVSTTMSNLALVYYAKNRTDKAFYSIKRAIKIDDKMIRNVFSIANEKQKLAYIGVIQDKLDILFSVVLSHQTPSRVRFAFDSMLRRKGIVTELLAMQREQLLAKKNPHLKSEFEELSHIRNMMMRRHQEDRTPRDLARTQEEIEELDKRRESLEKELSRRIPEYAIERRIAAVDAVGVSKLLRKGSALVEFVRFYEYGIKLTESGKRNLLGEDPRYSAFICRKDAPNKLEMIDLGGADVIDGAIADLRKVMIGEKGSEQDSGIVSGKDDPKTMLEQLILRKIESSFEGCKEVVICPDGQLNFLPFEILRCKDGKMLIDNHIVSYLGTGRDLLRVKRNVKKQHGPPKVIADPDFNLTVDRKGEKETKETHCRRSREFEKGKNIVTELPATKFEGKFIASLLNVKPMMRGDALEGKIRKMLSPRILHIATHGFFFQDNDWNEISKAGRMDFGSNLERLAAKLENPLLRSGLVLAGYNTYQRGGGLPSEAEDGTLTALDVSEMDLSGTELVVLSACGTGLGDIRVGEGVFGLRRTFALAGAKTLIVSLWPVDDLATMLLMNRFYGNLLKRKMPKAESLREAQLYLRGLTGGEVAKKIDSEGMQEHFDSKPYEAHQDEKPFSDPKFWGAFICIGDPGPLT